MYFLVKAFWKLRADAPGQMESKSFLLWALVLVPFGSGEVWFHGPLFGLWCIIGMYLGPDYGPILWPHRKTLGCRLDSEALDSP